MTATYLTLLLFLLPLGLQAEIPPRFKSRVYGKETIDIPTNLTKSIFQDSLGFIWIGSDNGLIQFSGTGFKTYTTELPGIYVKKVVSTPAEKHPVVVSDGGIGILESLTPPRFRTLIRSTVVPTDTTVFYPKTVMTDSRNRLWISEPNAICLYNQGRLTRFPFSDQFRANHFFRSFQFIEIPDGTILTTSQKGGLFRFDEGTARFIPVQVPGITPNMTIDAFFQDSGNRLWLGTLDGLFRLDLGNGNQTGELTRVTGITHVSTLAESDGQLFIGTWTSGLYVTRPSRPELTYHIDELKMKVINELFRARDGTIWIASDEGFGFVQPTAFTSVELSPVSFYVQKVHPAGTSTVLATEGTSVFKVEAHPAGEVEVTELYSQSASLLMALTGTENHFFAGYRDGYIEEIINRKMVRRYQFPLGPDNNRIINSLAMDDDGSVYFQVQDFLGFGVITPEKKLEIFGPDQRIQSDVEDVLLDKENRILYLGSSGKNSFLYRYSLKTKTLENLSENRGPGVPENLMLNHMSLDPAGTLWLATSSGLFACKNGRIETALPPGEKPFGLKSVLSFRPGEVWLGYEQGLILFRDNELVRFDASNGLGNITLSFRALAATPDGRVWTGTAAGVSFLSSPVSFHVPKTRMPVILSTHSAATDFDPADRNLSLPFYSGFSVSAASLMFPNETVKYQYRLAGSDSAWSELTSQSQFFFSDLPSGKYSLEVIARQNGHFRSDPMVLNVTVLPAWFETWWAYTLFLVTLAGVVFTALKVRRNIQEKKTAEKNLVVSERQDRELVQAIPDFWARVNQNLIITSFHHGPVILPFIRFADQLKGASVLSAFPESISEPVVQALKNLFEAGSHDHYDFIWTESGTDFDFEVRFLLLANNEALLLIRDISQQKQLERELIKARESAIEVSRLKSDFLATMSHEIRTPMNGVIGMASLLQQTRLSIEQTEYVQSLKFSGEQLLHLINDILDFSKIESGKMELEHKPFSLIEAVEKVLTLFTPKALDKKLKLFTVFDPDIPEFIFGDENRLRQVLSNLVDNAIKFTPVGYILISAELRESTREIKIHVRDSGIGIPESKRLRLFESFYQVDASVTRKFGGSGLGLAICKRISQLMGGDLTICSREGNGSIFTVSLPCEVPDSVAVLGSFSAGYPPVAFRLSGMNHREKLLFRKLFRGLGFTVDSALLKSSSDQVLTLEPAVSIQGLGGYQISSGSRKSGITHFISRYQVNQFLREVWHHRPDKTAGLSQPAAEPDSAPVQSLRILIAEDNPVNQVLIKRMLQKLGFASSLAVNGIEAVKMFSQDPFDFIFMDVQMPVMDGLEATREIRKISGGINPVIIALTANAMEKDREICLEAGMNDYLPKPVILEEVDKIMKKWIAALKESV